MDPLSMMMNELNKMKQESQKADLKKPSEAQPSPPTSQMSAHKPKAQEQLLPGESLVRFFYVADHDNSVDGTLSVTNF